MAKHVPWREHVRMALHNLATHRLRSLLTTLGIIVGVFSVIAVVSLMRAAENRLLHDMGADKTRVFGLSPWTQALEKTPDKVRRFTLEELAELQARVPQIQFLSPSVRLGRLPVKTGSRQIIGDVQALDEHGLDLGNLVIAHGRNFTPTDRIMGLPAVILGPAAAKDLGLGPKDLGKGLTIGGQTAELVGILERVSGPFGRLTEKTVAVPYGSFKGLGGADLLSKTRWRLSMDETLSVPQAKERLSEALRRVRGLRSTDPENYTIRSNEKILNNLGKVTGILMAGAGSLLGISLLVGGIGVMNIMLVTVAERTREIGIRKAIGARRQDILRQFLVESAVLCALGGLAGLSLGVAFGDMVGRMLLGATVGVPLWASASAILVPAATGMVFGIYPARKAACMDIIDALRLE